MDATILAALIGAAATVLIAVLTMAWQIVRYIIDTYKQQADRTVDAKNAEIAAKDQEIDRLRDGVAAELHSIGRQVGELRQDVWSWRREGS